MSLVSEIGARLSSQSVGGLTSTATWRIVYFEPLPMRIGSSQQQQQIVIIPTGGFSQEAAEFVDRPTFQIRVEGASSVSSTALDDKLGGVETALNLQNAVTWSNRKYLFIQKLGDRFYLGRDELGRPAMVQDYAAMRSRTS